MSVRMTRRAMLGTGLLAVSGALIAACGGAPASPAAPTQASGTSSTQAPTATPAQAAAAAKPTVAPTPVAPVVTVPPSNVNANLNGVEVRIGASTEYYAMSMRMFRDQIEKEFGVKLKIDVVPSNDMYQRNLTEFTSGTSSYDIFLFLPFQLADYAPHLESLDDLMKGKGLDLKLGDVLPVFRDVYSTWDGKVVSMPFDGDVHLFFYNKDAFENTDLQKKYKDQFGADLKPPTTYDEYLQMAQFFTENTWRKDGQKGFGTSEGLNGAWWWENRLGSYGAVYFDENMNPLINSKNAIAAAENYVKMVKYMPPGSNSFGYQEVENALVKGDVAMSINWSSAGRTSMNPQKSTTVGRIGSAPTPAATVNGQKVQRDALCTGWSLGIPKYSKNKDAASYVLWFLTRPEVALQHILNTDTGIDAYRTSQLENADFIKIYGQDYVKAIKDGLAVGFPDLQVPNSQEYYQRLQEGLQQATAGTKPVKDALDGAAEEWKKITQRMGTDKQATAWNKSYDKMKAAGIKFTPMP